MVRSRFVAPETGAERPREQLIKLQRDLMQDVGPEVSVHVPALLPVPVAHMAHTEKRCGGEPNRCGGVLT